MKQFLLRLCLFILPIALLYGFALIFFVYGREFTPLADVIQEQRATSTVLYRLAYDNNAFAYKLGATVARDPKIIVLGTSRAMQFRSEFFNDPLTFYNAGGMHNNADYLRFIEHLPVESRVKFILLDVEPGFLTTESPISAGEEHKSAIELFGNFLTNGWREAYADYFKGKFALIELIEKSRTSSSIGIAALTTDTGFRNDGSYRPDAMGFSVRQTALGEQIALGLANIASNRDSFGSVIEPKNVEDMRRFLALCRARHIAVIGFIPPSAREEHDALLMADNSFGETTRSSYALLENIFKAEGYQLYDVSSLATVGSSNLELLDNGHGSEKTYLRILGYLREREPSLVPYIRPDTKTLLRNSKNEVEVL